MKPSDLRGILQYVPLFQGHIFVVAIDGSIVAHENFENILTDLAVLRSLDIHLVLVHGIGHQLTEAVGRESVADTTIIGDGPTDGRLLDLAVSVSGKVSSAVMAGLTRVGLRCSISNAIRMTEVGVIGGVDYLHSGKPDKVDREFFAAQIKQGVVSVVPPIGFDRDGVPYRVNSDRLAARLAKDLAASKLIFLANVPGLQIDGVFQMNVPVDEVRAIIREAPQRVDPHVLSKARYAVATVDEGVPRAHILDGTVNDGLLTEVFSKVGIGTMIHGNAYQEIRPAREGDIPCLVELTRNAADSEALRKRSAEDFARVLDALFVYEIDSSIIACVSVVSYPAERMSEIGGVMVQPFYQGQGVGRRIVDFAERVARERGDQAVFALTTQSYGFFKTSCGYRDGAPDDLPRARREQFIVEGRNSRILLKTFG